MKVTAINLGKVSISIEDYASQGNAILGIRDSGKTSTATYVAEQLIEAGIPFIAFDPIGVWRFLRVPGKGNAYPVVVAGGRFGDLKLTPESAPQIVRAAMRENIPLVIDLYDITLSKADWKRIVEQSVRLLLYENGECGLRHLFIEEASEFVPQRIGPEQGRVYAEMEKLARMGGNALLGYTLINQRAEEVNKAVLELCNCIVLHQQTGRNSIAALSKWFNMLDVKSADPVIKSLSRLERGEAWIWNGRTGEPFRVKVPIKNTAYPDRRARVIKSDAHFEALDVSDFVQRLSASLEKQKGEKPKVAEPLTQISEIKDRTLDTAKRIEDLEVALAEAVSARALTENQLNAKDALILQLQESIARAGEILQSTAAPSATSSPPSQDAMPAPFGASEYVPMNKVKRLEERVESNSRVSKMGKKIFATLVAEYPDFPQGLSRAKLGLLTGYVTTGGAAYSAIKDLKERHLVTITGSGADSIISINRELLK